MASSILKLLESARTMILTFDQGALLFVLCSALIGGLVHTSWPGLNKDVVRDRPMMDGHVLDSTIREVIFSILINILR